MYVPYIIILYVDGESFNKDKAFRITLYCNYNFAIAHTFRFNLIDTVLSHPNQNFVYYLVKEGIERTKINESYL